MLCGLYQVHMLIRIGLQVIKFLAVRPAGVSPAFRPYRLTEILAARDHGIGNFLPW